MDYEVEYNNRARTPEHPEIIARWERDSADYRSSHPGAEIGLAYGPTERTIIDVFPGDRAISGRRPVVMFIHGGYWQSLDKDRFSFLARGANAHGFTVALPSYDLCPNVTLPVIIEQIRAACLWLWERFESNLVLLGHSAGGHLAAAMLTTDWRAFHDEAPADLVAGGLAVSGVFDLEPLIPTSINTALRLDRNTARDSSPVHWSPRPGTRLIAAVGADESSEFLRQSRMMCDVWNGHGADCTYLEVSDANHFTVIEPFADPASDLTARLVALAQQASGFSPEDAA